MSSDALGYIKKAIWLIILFALFVLYELGGFNPVGVCCITLTFCVWALFQIELTEEIGNINDERTYQPPPTPIPTQEPIKEQCCHEPRRARPTRTRLGGKSRSKSPLLSTSAESNVKTKHNERLSSLKKISFHIAKLNKNLADIDSDEKSVTTEMAKD